MNVPTCCQKQDLDKVGYDIYEDNGHVVEEEQFMCQNCGKMLSKLTSSKFNGVKWIKQKEVNHV
jgi:transposase-like protein